MAFDGIVVANLVKEFSDKLTGGRINRIAQPEADDLNLTIKSGRETYRLFLSANPSLPLAYLVEEATGIAPMTAPNFCMLLRKHIGNAKILSVTQPGLERVISFNLEHLDEMGDLHTKSLVIEIMGKHSNILLVDENGVILDAIRHVSASMSSVREVLPGRPYFIPNTEGKSSPLDTSREEFFSALKGGKEVPFVLSGAYTGLSRPSMIELVSRCGVSCDTPAEALGDEQKEALWQAFSAMAEDIRRGQFSPCIAFRDEEPVEFASILLTSYTDCEVVPYGSVSELLREYYSLRSRTARMRQKSADLRRLLQTLTERTAKKYELQTRQLKDTEKREKNRLYGELLHIYGYDCPPKAKSFEAVDYNTGETVNIPLDPDLTAAENASRYYEKYNKQKRTYEALSGLIRETEAELSHLESILTSVDMAANDADLAEIRKELAESGYIRSSGPKARKDNRRKSLPYHYISSDGFDIYVGKNNYQNEELTFKLAQGNDIWMHAKKIPGSHVIIQTGGRTVPDRTYEEAGSLAVYYSKARTADKAEVDYIERKHVKKPAGAKPGYVIYHTNYSLVASPDIGGIKCVEGFEV